ncbi:hypothetical protein RIF29_29293 [Crotalaria pallida]|uniref:Uncharacterized protein n=1 Tax=Crotalaria pallida TaxID=3830 RepID=A0AAN9EEQ6_CROPI
MVSPVSTASLGREKEDDVVIGDDELASNVGGEEGCSDNKDDDAVRWERKNYQNSRKKSRRSFEDVTKVMAT